MMHPSGQPPVQSSARYVYNFLSYVLHQWKLFSAAIRVEHWRLNTVLYVRLRACRMIIAESNGRNPVWSASGNGRSLHASTTDSTSTAHARPTTVCRPCVAAAAVAAAGCRSTRVWRPGWGRPFTRPCAFAPFLILFTFSSNECSGGCSATSQATVRTCNLGDPGSNGRTCACSPPAATERVRLIRLLTARSATPPLSPTLRRPTSPTPCLPPPLHRCRRPARPQLPFPGPTATAPPTGWSLGFGDWGATSPFPLVPATTIL